MKLFRSGGASAQSPTVKLILSIAGVFVIGLVFQLIAGLLAELLFPGAVLGMLGDGSDLDRTTLNGIKFVQTISAAGMFIFGSLWMSNLYTNSWFAFFDFHGALRNNLLLLLLLMMIITFPFTNLLYEWNQHIVLPFEGLESKLRALEDQADNLMMSLVRVETIWGLFFNLFMIAVIPALGEELFFRGLIQKHLQGAIRNPHVAILLAAAFFSIAHLQFYTFFPRLWLGLILGYAYYYSGNLWYPIAGHFINNAFGVIGYYFFFNGGVEQPLEDIGTSEALPLLGVLSMIAVGGLMWIWVRLAGSPSRHP